MTRSGAAAKSKSNRVWWIASGAIVLAIAAGTTAMIAGGSRTERPDLLYHPVRYETIDLTVVERGALESSENKEVTCMVKATKGGNFATTIKWVIDDGTRVEQGKLLCTLDSAALEEQLRAQIIAESTAATALVKANSDLDTIIKENDEALLKAENMFKGALLDLEKYVGLKRGSLAGLSPEERRKHVQEMEKNFAAYLETHQQDFGELDGEFKQLLDDVNGRIETAEAEFEQWKDKAAYSRRMALRGYVTQSQAQADESRLNSARETLKKLATEKRLLQTFVAQKSIQDYCSALREAEIALERTNIQTTAKLVQARAEVYNKRLTLEQEQAKLEDINDQIKRCRIHSPQDGMVVYYVPEQSRWGGGSQQSIIAQGEPVREGQKLMRIPNLRKMQVVARVHEATISRIKGDVYRPTGFTEAVRAAAMINRNFLPQLCLLKDEAFEDFRTEFSDRDLILASRGQPARVRVDAFGEKPLAGHVKSVAAVASQDFFTSDVKVYQTVISIDEYLEGLRPGMSAEVTIQIADALENVLAVPLQAIIGGAEEGEWRKVYVKSDGEPKERRVRIGLSNDTMAEVREGLVEGEEVVTNPKAILGDKAKTREDAGKEKGKGGGMYKGPRSK